MDFPPDSRILLCQRQMVMMYLTEAKDQEMDQITDSHNYLIVI